MIFDLDHFLCDLPELWFEDFNIDADRIRALSRSYDIPHRGFGISAKAFTKSQVSGGRGGRIGKILAASDPKVGGSERAIERAVAKFVKVASLAGEACFFKFCLKRNAACIACNFPLCDRCDGDCGDISTAGICLHERRRVVGEGKDLNTPYSVIAAGR